MSSAEVSPFAKVGGLADVVGSLPPALEKEGCEVKVIMPKYGLIDEKKYNLKKVKQRIKVASDDKERYVSFWKSKLPGSRVEVFFIGQNDYFGKKEVYFGNNSERFLFFSLAVLNVIPHLNFKPDVIHCHDFHTALIPDLIKANPEKWGQYKTLYTIHNLNYQGKSDPEVLSTGNLTKNSLKSLSRDARDGNINFMVQGIIGADKVNTVSPTYAREIATHKYGAGLDKVIRQNKNKITGIINGIDTDYFDPRKDKNLKVNYSVKSLNKKRENKLYLQKKCGLPRDKDIPLVGLVSRLAWQKGLELIDEELIQLTESHLNPRLADRRAPLACPEQSRRVKGRRNQVLPLNKEDKNQVLPLNKGELEGVRGCQFVFLGTGEKKYEERLKKLAQKYPDKVSANIMFDLKFAQQIYAGADIFLMPSRFEPCGLGQMIAMRYGTIPVARATGGLADTVDENVGFKFKEFKAKPLKDTLDKALNIYHKEPKKWKKMQKTAMKKDFSWQNSADKYIEVYKKILD